MLLCKVGKCKYLFSHILIKFVRVDFLNHYRKLSIEFLLFPKNLAS